MKCLARAVVAILALLAPIAAAYGQATVLQGGSWAQGHVPCYSSNSGQTIVSDCGPARGGTVGLGASEFLMVARGTGTPPYVGQGTGPLGTTFCSYDAPTNNAAGYHYLCMGANPSQIVAGAGGIASPIPFCFTVNGAPMCLGATTGTGIVTATLPTTAGAPSCWVNASGKLTDCSAGAATLFGRPTTSGIPAPFTIQGLTARGPPDANNDKIPVYDNASGTIKYVTPGLIAASATAGVSSIASVVGALTLGPSLSMVGSQITFTPAGTNGQIQYNNAGALGGFGPINGDIALTVPGAVATIQPNAVTTAKILDANVTTSKILDANVTTSKILDANVTNAKLATGAANTVKGSINGTTTSDLTIASCSAIYQFTQWISGTGWSCGITPVLPSRAVAATLNLSAFSSVQTLGYAAPGDGGDATFIKTSGRFLDTFVSAGTISNAGSAYTNGTYLYVPLTGSATGLTLYANVEVISNVVSSVTILNVNGKGAASLAGDVLTTANTNIGGTGSGFTFTISTMTTVLASFTDASSNRFQYVVGAGNFINPRQFGCKFDWLGVDATATDDGNCLQMSMNFASVTRYPRQDLGGTLASTRVMLPAGSAKICQGLILPGATQLFGQGPFNSTIKVCDSGLSSSTHILTVCDQNAHVACFGPQVGQLGINAFNASGSANTFAIFSNAAQQTRWIDNVTIYSGTRGCIQYEKGWGGAANASVYDVFCTINTGAPNDAVLVAGTVGTTLVNFRNTIIESGGAGFAGNGFNIGGGQVTIDGYHFEGIAVGANINQTVATHSTTIMHLTGGSGCTNAVVLQSTNTPGNFAIYDGVKQGACANLVLNGQPSGSNRAADAKPSAGWVSFP